MIKEVFAEFFSKETHKYVFVYLWDDPEYVEEIIRICYNIDTLSPDLSKHIVLTTDVQYAEHISRLENLDLDIQVVPLSVPNFIGHLEGTLNAIDNEQKKYLVPGRTQTDEKAIIDITDIYHKLVDDNIKVVYQSIYLKTKYDRELKVPAFLKGESIDWDELAVGADVDRYRYQELYDTLRGLLTGLKKSVKFEILHKPGAGGTILGHKLAFQLRELFPTIMIDRYDSKTFKSLSLLLDRVNQTVLSVVEAADVDVNNLEELIRICNSRKLNVCFVYIKRTLKAEKSMDLTFFLDDVMADRAEMERFLRLLQLYSHDKIVDNELSKRQPSECEVIDFALSISETDYNKTRLDDYVGAYIAKMPDNQISFSVFVCFVYYYSQKKVSHLIFRSLFKKGLPEELRHIARSNQYIRKILIQQFDSFTQDHTEYWRPRFSKFAEAVLANVLGNGKKENWKDQIAAYAKRFIQEFKANNEYLVEETSDILKGVFFDRENEDSISTQQWASNGNNESFSQLIRDIGTKDKQKEVLTALVDAYPNQSQFQGQMGRFTYEKAEELGEFYEAEAYINLALQTEEGASDYNLHHLGGMCKRREIEFLHRKYAKTGELGITEARLKELAERACFYFEASVSINPYNIHGYVAQIQTLMDVIDFGRELSGKEGRWSFLTAEENRWYLEKYSVIQKLIETAKILIESQESLGQTRKTIKANKYVREGEGRALDLIGDFNASTEVYRSLIDTVERAYRPQMRLMAVYSTLLGKVKGNRRNMKDAWSRLKPDEVTYIRTMLNDNILQDPTNIVSFKLWFNLVRFSSIDISIDEVISILRVWYDHSEGSRALKLEVAFYLYVLYACQVISAGESFSINARNQCAFYIDKCKELTFNPKYLFEYLGYGNAFDSLINHKDRSNTDDEMFRRVDGIITSIEDRQKGKITLSSGLEAFFVPIVGLFVQGQDETSEVTFKLGFRHEGLFAIDVRKKIQTAVLQSHSVAIIEELIEDMPIETLDQESLDEKQEHINDNVLHRLNYVIQAPKVIDKIDLSKIRDTRKKKK